MAKFKVLKEHSNSFHPAGLKKVGKEYEMSEDNAKQLVALKLVEAVPDTKAKAKAD